MKLGEFVQAVAQRVRLFAPSAITRIQGNVIKTRLPNGQEFWITVNEVEKGEDSGGK